MSLNHLTQSTPIQEYLNIGCNDMKCNSLTVNDVPITGDTLFSSIGKNSLIGAYNETTDAGVWVVTGKNILYTDIEGIPIVADGDGNQGFKPGLGHFKIEARITLHPGAATQYGFRLTSQTNASAFPGSETSHQLAVGTDSETFYTDSIIQITDPDTEVYMSIRDNISSVTEVLSWSMTAVKLKST